MEIAPYAEQIFYARELISQDLCQRIIALYCRDARKRRGFTVGSCGKKQKQAAIKLTTDLEIREKGEWSGPCRALNQAVDAALQTISGYLPALQVWPLKWTGYKIQHYTRGEGYFKWHFDAVGPGTWDRQLAMVLYLNSVREGGETCFHLQDRKVKPIAGDAVFFPTFWTHTHCAAIPRSEDKYIISSFISFALPVAAQKLA